MARPCGLLHLVFVIFLIPPSASAQEPQSLGAIRVADPNGPDKGGAL